MPIDPVTRAQFRVALYRLERDWYALARDIEQGKQNEMAAHSRKVLTEAICASAEVFKAKPFFLSDEFSLVDASIAPILWRLQSYGIQLPAQAQPIVKYMNSIFARSAFRACLTEAEKEMRH
jgi:RNA polymerase-associated protein